MSPINKIITWFKDNNVWFHQSKFYFLLFVFLLLVGAWLAFPKNWAFSGGEFHSLFAVKGISEFGIPRMPSGVIYWRNFVSHYLQVLPVSLFGMSEFSMRLPFFILFFPFVFLFFNYINKSYNLSSAFISLSLLVSSGWFLRYSQNIRFFSLALILLFFSYYFFDRYFFKEGSSKQLIYFIIFSSLGILNSQLGWSVMILPVVYLVYNVVNIKAFFRNKYFRDALFSLLILITFFYLSSQIPSRVAGEASFLEGISSFSGVGRGSTILDKIIFGFLSVFSFNSSFIDIFISWFPFLFYFYISVFAFIFVVKKSSRLEKLLPFIFFFSFLMLISLMDKNREPPRIISVLSPFFYIGIGVGLAYIVSFLKKILGLSKLKSRLLLVSFLIISALVVNQNHLIEYIEASNGDDEVLTGPLNSSYEPFYITSSKDANEYVLDNYQEGDKIISTKIFGWDNYYLNGQLDYTLMTGDLSRAAPGLIIKTNLGYRLVYHDVDVIRDLSELKDIINNNRRVWLITNDRVEEYNNEAVVDFISRDGNVVYQGEVTSFKVFLYGN